MAILNRRDLCQAVFPAPPPKTDTPPSRFRRSQRSGSNALPPARGALLDLPQTVVLPGQHMVRIGFQRPLIPDLRELVVAEFAIGITDQIGHVRMIVMAERS